MKWSTDIILQNGNFSFTNVPAVQFTSYLISDRPHLNLPEYVLRNGKWGFIDIRP